MTDDIVCNHDGYIHENTYKYIDSYISALIDNESYDKIQMYCMIIIGECYKCKIEYLISLLQVPITDKKRSAIMFALGNLYCVMKQYDEMKKCYQICIDNNYKFVFFVIGDYYRINEKNIDKSLPYYFAGISQKCDRCACEVSIYYHHQKNMILSKKYYILQLEFIENFDEVFMRLRYDTIFKISPFELYCSISNDKLKEYLYEKYDIIKPFVDCSSDDMCQSCFHWTKCIEQYDQYFCYDCYNHLIE